MTGPIDWSCCEEAGDADSCRCSCHAWALPGLDVGLGQELLDGIMAGLRERMEAHYRDWSVEEAYALNEVLDQVRSTPAAPPVDPDRVVWADSPEIQVTAPNSPHWTADLDVMVVGPGQDPEETASIEALYAWAAQRALETRILEEMEAILKARPADAPGVLLIRRPEETVMVESQWIPPGTLIYSMPDQPDLMVKPDPDGPGVIYYRQTRP